MNLKLEKNLIFSAIMLACSFPLFAQKKQYTLNENRSTVSLIVDLKQTKYTVSEIQSRKRGAPLPEAKHYSLNINTDTVGVWTIGTKENIWKLDIDVPKAKGFFVGFDDFYLPEGTQLYVYNKNKMDAEAIVYRHEDNPMGGTYSIENLTGDNVVLEYVAPNHIVESPRFTLSGLGYKYIDDKGDNLTGFDSSNNSCMINIICPEGELWQDQKKGVVQLRMLKSNGQTYLCSGTLINNTANDATPYVLTADHCFENMTRAQINNNTEFIFEYESATCQMKDRPRYKYHKGAEVLVLSPIKDGSDGALLKLSEPIPEQWDIYFNGWDRENKAALTGSIIHHPLGDVKKITLYNKPLTSGRWSSSSPIGAHWLVTYSAGATEGGSSGSPIFNQSGLVVGTLTGGDNDCRNPSLADYYGKLYFHWDQYRDVNEHMDKYLDPGKTGVTKLAGLRNSDNPERKLVLDNTILNIVENTTFGVNILSGNGGYTVTSSDNSIASASVNNNVIHIQGYRLGDAIVTVKDKLNKSVDINVMVHKEIDIVFLQNKVLEIKVYGKDNIDDMITEVMLIDLDANTLQHKKNINETIFNLDMSAYSRGVYIIKVKTQKGISKAEKITW
ncbi:trypsin-like peptidase domain-containing protein [Dysgonomonas sp. Marseille-P4677]|uniref:trypsin-like peptidase domain-containing protein n=1 Tax=Dysgonomonas sp. Marseille-P4677 TaxID=2364790 RepID=UPI0019128FC4|nr:trypsin-like peptidase domain-containing protein [Dysgonomonas sp. Marseille-P4677]MBK5721285.1 trypsin-like peptidase domain-containing protein [Dysgonomonas sp. Marseille-P4677]